MIIGRTYLHSTFTSSFFFSLFFFWDFSYFFLFCKFSGITSSHWYLRSWNFPYSLVNVQDTFQKSFVIIGGTYLHSNQIKSASSSFSDIIHNAKYPVQGVKYGYLEQFLYKKVPPPSFFQKTRMLNMFLFLLGLSLEIKEKKSTCQTFPLVTIFILVWLTCFYLYYFDTVH